MAFSKRDRPTLKTISELCGLAVPTVSRALHNAPDIATATKDRVRQVAAEIGYVPNRAGLHLRTGKTNVIAFLISTEMAMQDHIGQIIASIANSLEDTEYNLIVTPHSSGQDSLDQLRDIIKAGTADGVILSRAKPRDARVRYLMEQNFPFVTYGRSDWQENHAFYDFDNHSFAKFAVTALAQEGRRKLVMIAPQQDLNYARNMVLGGLAIAEELNLFMEIAAEVNSDDTVELVAEYSQRLLSSRKEVDGLVCASSSAAIGAILGAERAGRKIGQDLDICSKVFQSKLQLIVPEVIAIHEAVVPAGQFLGQAAIHAIENPEARPMQFLAQPSPPKSIKGLDGTGL